MAPLGWSGGSQFSSTLFPFVSPVTVSMRGVEGAVDMAMIGTLKEGRITELHTVHALGNLCRIRTVVKMLVCF